jgi:hypothetical protein
MRWRIMRRSASIWVSPGPPRTPKVGPAADEAALLVIEMGKFNLQAAFRCRSAFTENLENKPRAVDDLALESILEIALLDRGKRTVNDHKLGRVLFAPRRDILDLTGTEQGIGLHLPHRQDRRVSDDHTDGERQPLGLGKPFGRVEIIAQCADVRAQD